MGILVRLQFDHAVSSWTRRSLSVVFLPQNLESYKVSSKEVHVSTNIMQIMHASLIRQCAHWSQWSFISHGEIMTGGALGRDIRCHMNVNYSGASWFILLNCIVSYLLKFRPFKALTETPLTVASLNCVYRRTSLYEEIVYRHRSCPKIKGTRFDNKRAFLATMQWSDHPPNTARI